MHCFVSTLNCGWHEFVLKYLKREREAIPISMRTVAMSYISLGRAQKRSTWCLIIAMFALASVKYSVIHIFGHVKYRCVVAILKDLTIF